MNKTLGSDQIYHHPRRNQLAPMQFYIAAGRFFRRKGWTIEEIKIVFDLLSDREISEMVRRERSKPRSKYEPHQGLRERRHRVNAEMGLYKQGKMCGYARYIDGLMHEEQEVVHELGFLTGDTGLFNGLAINADGSVVRVS